MFEIENNTLQHGPVSEGRGFMLNSIIWIEEYIKYQIEKKGDLHDNEII